MNYVLIILGIVSTILSLKEKKWGYALISIGLSISPLLILMDNEGLFYHSLGLLLCSTITMLILIYLDQASETKRTIIASSFILIPYVLVCTFKMFKLWGISYLSWSLLLSILSFLYITFERKRLDHLWFLFLFIALSSGLIFYFWH